VIGRKLVPNAKLTPSRYVLTAVNKTDLPILGDTNLTFEVDGHKFWANVSVSDQVDDFLLGSDILSARQAKWDFATGTITVGEKQICAYRCLRKNACCRVIVTENFGMPAKHEANVPVKLLGSDHLYPQIDWTIEPCELQKGVVAARTLVSSDQKRAVARVCNYSNEPIEFKANAFLGLAEPAEYVPGTGQKTVKPSLESCNDSTNVAVQTGKKTELRVPKGGSRAKPGAVMHYSRASIVSATPSAQVTEPAASAPDRNPYAHIQCLIDGLPIDLTSTERETAAAFIRGRASVFSRSEFDIGRKRIIPHRIDTEIVSHISSSLDATLRLSCPSLMPM